MPLLIKRHDRFRNHLAPAVPRHFVCACCGGKVVEQWHAEGSLIVCAGDINRSLAHNGLMTECDWMESRPTRIESQPAAIDDAIALDKEVQQVVAEYRRRRRQQTKKALYGEE